MALQSEIGYTSVTIGTVPVPAVIQGGLSVLPDWHVRTTSGTVLIRRWGIVVGGAFQPLTHGAQPARLTLANKSVPPTVMDTGEPVGYFNATPVVSGGYLDSSTDSATYMEATLDRVNITRIGARWRFDSLGGTVGGGGSGTLAVVTWADGGIVTGGFGRRTSCHVTITASNVQWWIRDVEDGGNVTALAGRTIVGGLATDVDHTVEVTIGQGTGSVVIDGTAYDWTDPRIVRYPGEIFACWEPYYGGANKTRARIAEVWADGDRN